MTIDPGSPQARLLFRALGVTQRLVKKIGKGGTLSRDELRAGELATQALRACIANPSSAHRQELLIVEAERLAPRPPEERREVRRDERESRPQPRGAPRRSFAPARNNARTGDRKPPVVTIKKPKRIVTSE